MLEFLSDLFNSYLPLIPFLIGFAYPTALSRTKDWGTEIMTDSDLEGVFDAIITWVNAASHATTGHKHDATTSEAPKILATNLDRTGGSAFQGVRVNSGETAFEFKALPSDAILSGFELTTFAVDATAIVVKQGVLLHGVTVIKKTAPTTLTFATAGNWWDGAADSYAGGQGWCYVGVDIDGNIKLLGANPPDKSSYASDGVEGDASGTKYYWWDGATHWRVIGAVRVDTDNKTAWGQLQSGNMVMLDIPQNMSTARSYTWTAAGSKAAGDCATLIPALSDMGVFGLYVNHSGTQTRAGIWIRPNGTTWEGITHYANGLWIGAGNGIGGQRRCMLEAGTQKINYIVDTGDDAIIEIDVEGYVMNIR